MNLFNRMNTLVTGMPMTNNTGIKGTNTPTIGQQNALLTFGAQDASPLPTFNIANPAQIKQQTIVNQELQETIAQTQEVLNEFTQEDKSALVKAMLDLPDDMTQLLKNISNDKEKLTNTEFMKLLSSLNSQGKDALGKLSKLLVVFGANNLKGTEKLQELYTIINAYTSGNVQNASQLMKNMILLYLPWLPIGENNNFDLTLKNNNSEDDLSSDGPGCSDSVVILVQTVNYSNVSVTLSQSTNSSNIDMFVECAESFPKDELQNIVQSDAKSKNVKAEMSFSANKSSTEQKNEQLSYNVNVSKFLNPYLMLMSHAVIKAIIQIDKRTSLVDKRKTG